MHALARFRKSGMIEELSGADDIVIRPVPKHRVTLEYYKNGVLHMLLPGALVAVVIRAQAKMAFSAPDLLDGVRFQRRLLQQEFIMDPATVDTDLLGAGLTQLGSIGGLSGPDESGFFHVIERPRIGEMAELITNFLESYYLTLRAAPQLQGSTKEKVSGIQRIGAQLLAVQDLRRPEALSGVNLANALKMLTREGALIEQEGQTLALHPEHGRLVTERLRALLRMGNQGDESRLHGL